MEISGKSLNLQLLELVPRFSLGLAVNCLANTFAVNYQIDLPGITLAALHIINGAFSVRQFDFL